jgi:hypothetical protein
MANLSIKRDALKQVFLFQMLDQVFIFKSTTIFLPILLLMLLLAISGCKQENPPQHSSTASETETTSAKIKEENTDSVRVAYATSPLDIKVTQFPPNYEGHDPDEFFKNAFLVHNQFEKGEFENTKQFTKRVASFQSTPFIKPLKNNGEFAFRVIPNWPEYNADLQEFDLTFSVVSDVRELWKYGAGDDEYLSYRDVEVLVIKRLEGKKEFYAASNAFGATVPVVKTSEEVLGIILGDALQRPEELKQHLLYQGLKLHIPSEKAEDTRKKINLLVILKPEIPITEYMHKTHTPTIDYPYSEDIRLKLIVGHVVGAWLYNYKTGEIYKKYKLNK